MSKTRKEELREEISQLGEMFERANSLFKRMAISGQIEALNNELQRAEKES